MPERTDHNEALRLADALDKMRGPHLGDGINPGVHAYKLAALLRQQAEQIDQLRAEVERLRADAERYEWLRDNHESEWAICEWQDDPDGLGYYRDARAPEFVDAAIDAARTTHKDEA